MIVERNIREYRDIKTGQTKYIDMGNTEIYISVPEGYEIDKEKSSFEKIVFKPVAKKGLPKTWEELGSILGAVVRTDSQVGILCGAHEIRSCDKCIWPSEKEAKAAVALAQLCQLRDRYNDGWKPDWSNDAEQKYVIYISEDKISTSIMIFAKCTLAFKTKELRDEFLDNFRDLIEIAKPLL